MFHCRYSVYRTVLKVSLENHLQNIRFVPKMASVEQLDTSCFFNFFLLMVVSLAWLFSLGHQV